MKACGIVSSILCLIIGVAIGAGATYYQVKCKTTGMNIQLDSNAKTGPGITITKTGNSE